MLRYLSIGMLLGLSAGLAPGPLLALVIAETLKHDIKGGIKVALSPIVTDLPIIIGTVYLLAQLADFQMILGGISLTGGVFLLFVGCRDLRNKVVAIDIQRTESRSLAKGILTNALSPYPYLFWLTVGAPTLTKAAQIHQFAAAAFILGFYLCLLGAKVLLALLVGRFKLLFSSKSYLVTLRLLGIAVCAFAISLVSEGLKLLKIF